MILLPPPYNPQSSINGDTDSCGPQAILHAIEMSQDNVQRWSPRALAKLSGTKPGIGTNVNDVINAVNKYGLIPYDLWPDPLGNWTVDEYFDTIPHQILAQANKSYLVNLTTDLFNYPLLLLISIAKSLNHFVVQFNDTQIFDSYQPAIKPITTWQPQAIIKKWGLQLKLRNMTLGYKVSNPTKQGDQTVYIQAGNSLVPLADWQAFINLGGSEGSIVSLTQQQLDSLSVVTSDLFKSNN